ncbi:MULTISPECIES: 2-oxo acid dehydrogenase subunit E2 [unclassified Sphingobium]|uniref:2-oxo acid dehydrogenase subunit E2 n=1 Tax=unclassified Sphingobium TaxID=2611147 RepID=UPI0035A59CB1
MTDDPAMRGERYEITGIQKAVGDVFAANWRETPVVHVGIAINMAPAETFRRTHGAQHGQSISIMNIIQRATALAARDHPMIAAMFEPDSRTSLIVPHVDDIAVQGPVMVDGSAFPLIIEGASAKSLVTIAKEMQDAVATVRAGKFTQEDSLATFARMARTPNIGISNIGMIAPVNLFTAMSILPAVAHFFVAAAIETPMVNEDGVVVSAPMANFCLAFDHRALSAGPVAAYLGQFKQLMEHPERLI